MGRLLHGARRGAAGGARRAARRRARAMLPPAAPEQGEGWDAIVADLDRIVVPATTHWQHPGWYAYFPANGSGPSILGELVAAGLGMQGMLWSTGPVCTELETHVMDWLVELLALPSPFRSSGTGGGVIQHSASDAVLCAIVGRARAGGQPPAASWSPTARPRRTPRSRRICASRASRTCGSIAVDDAYAMRPDELAPPDRRRPRGGPAAVLLLRHARHHLVAGVRPGARDRRDLPRRRPLAARRRRDGRRGRHLPRAPVAQRRRRAGLELRHERRTSGCSRTSTATCSG